MAMHAWDQPAEELLSVGGKTGAQLMMPRLGEAIEPAHAQRPEPWWRAVDTIAPAPEPDTPACARNVPSLADSEHCAGAKDNGKVGVAGPQVKVAAAGLAELSVTVVGVGVSATHGGTLVVGHSALGACSRKNSSMFKNRLPSRPAISPAGLGLPGGAAPRNEARFART